MQLAMAAVAILTGDRFKSGPTINTVPAATALRGNQPVIACDILSFFDIICNPPSLSEYKKFKIKIFLVRIKNRCRSYFASTYCTSAPCMCGESFSLRQLSHLQRTGWLHPSHNSTISSSDPHALHSDSMSWHHLLDSHNK